jgi:hypothetical protein
MPQLISSLFYFFVRAQNTIHGADRTTVSSFIKQLRIDLGRRFVHEALLVQNVENLLPLDLT